MEIRHQMQTEERHHRTETKRDGVQPSKHHEQHPSAPASPPLPPSSPSPEFSFANPPPSVIPAGRNKTNPPPPIAVDLSPADDIFFRGHLLPLHLLSRLPVSPRSSINSSDSPALPAKESPECNCGGTAAPDSDPHTDTTSSACQERSLLEGSGSTGKTKSGSLFGLPRWRKEEEEGHLREGQKRKSKFDMSHFLQKYMRLIKPFIVSLRNRRSGGDSQIHRQNHSLSGNLRFRSKLKGLRGRRECSAPASMSNSPANSGVLIGGGNNNSSNNTSGGHSTMEELQAAIQAAIAHCKNSIAAEEKNKQP